MQTRTFTVSLMALIAGLAIGFLTANRMNRSEMDRLRAENAIAKESQSPPATGTKLTDKEIRAGIKRADESPGDLLFQRNMGIALYRYGSANKDVGLIKESIRLLQRVLDSDASNVDINIALGNAYFDIGYFESDAESFARSRTYYEAALAKRSDDAAVITDYGLTFFLQAPADYDRALTEFEKALRLDPKNERALEYAIQIYVKREEFEKAKQAYDGLKNINPTNPALTGLATLVAGVPEPSQ